MSSFTLSPATISDLPDIAKILRAAFRDNRHSMSYWTFPLDNEATINEWRLNEITNTFNHIPYCTYTKVVDITVGRVVAFALWEMPHKLDVEKENTQKEQEKKGDRGEGDALPEGTKVKLLHDFEAETQKMRAKYVDNEKDYSE